MESIRYIKISTESIRIINPLKFIEILSFSVAVFAYFFQFPFSNLSVFIIPSLSTFLIVSFLENKKYRVNQQWIKIFFVYIFYLFLMFTVAVIKGNPLNISLRFFLILLCIPLFTILKFDDFSIEFNIFYILAICKALLIIYYAFVMVKSGSFLELRRWALQNQFGDIYINPYTHLPTVQVMGNGILPVAFMINGIFYRRGRGARLLNSILLIGIIFAGNSAYILAVTLYLAYLCYRYIFVSRIQRLTKYLIFIFLIVGLGLFCFYAIQQLELKVGYSNAVRLYQTRVLLKGNFWLGNGLGNLIVSNGLINYSGNYYFELQTIYIINQIGVLGISIFYYLVLSMLKMTTKINFVLFFIYLIYSFWNPYCFDSTEMIVILLLTNISPLNDRSSSYFNKSLE